MTQTMTYTGQLVVTTCWCGIACAIPADLYRRAQDEKNFGVHCPLGHTFVYSKTDAERERERATRLESDLRRARIRQSALQDQADAAERSARAYKGHVTRLRNRIQAGLCPVEGCRRNFANVKGHIARMHPDWMHEHPEVME